MFCTNCGGRLNDDALFCPGCGTSVNSVESTTPEEKKETKPLQMREVHIYANKPGFFNKSKIDYYIYIDDTEYRYSKKRKDPLIIKVTPEIHVVEALTHKKTDSGIAGVYGALLDIPSIIASKMGHKQDDITVIDGSEEGVVTLKLSLNPLTGSVKITEEN